MAAKGSLTGLPVSLRPQLRAPETGTTAASGAAPSAEPARMEPRAESPPAGPFSATYRMEPPSVAPPWEAGSDSRSEGPSEGADGGDEPHPPHPPQQLTPAAARDLEELWACSGLAAALLARPELFQAGWHFAWVDSGAAAEDKEGRGAAAHEEYGGDGDGAPDGAEIQHLPIPGNRWGDTAVLLRWEAT